MEDVSIKLIDFSNIAKIEKRGEEMIASYSNLVGNMEYLPPSILDQLIDQR